MSFRIFTPWDKPRFAHGAHSIKHEWPDGSPMPHDMVNAILNGSPVSIRNPLRFLMKTKVGVRLRDVSITNIENSTIGTFNLHGKIKQKTVNRTSSPFASFFSRLG